jgi:hypothetical protein
VAKANRGKLPFRFYDNREKYLMFVTTCSEKWEVAARVAEELPLLTPTPPALRLFDAGMGDGTVLTRVLRAMHQRFATVPFLAVGKEISLEDVRLTIEKLPDRFHEHPQMVFVATNMFYGEAPRLMPRSESAQAKLNWQVFELDGSTTHDFDLQIRKQLQPLLADGWRITTSQRTGNPIYERPSVVVIYRRDHRFVLDGIIPRAGQFAGLYDLVLASQPYQARAAAETKVRNVLAPLARALAPNGRMIVVQSTGKDPGMEIIRRLWPEEQPFATPRHVLVKTLQEALKGERPRLRCLAYPDKRALFRYSLHTLPTEVSESIGTSTLMAAWNAAVYVAQIEDARLMPVLDTGAYLDATRDVLKKHGGLWFTNEAFAVVRDAQ